MENYEKIEFKYPVTPGRISVIIPVYRDPAGIHRTLLSIREKQIDDVSVEIIVVNDGADKETADVCRNQKVRMLEIIPNGGSYFARNRGLEYASGEYIVFLDADVQVQARWLEKALKAMEEVDYLAGNVCIETHPEMDSASWYEFFNAFPVKKYLEEEHFGVTAGLMVRRRVIEELGGFDQRLRSGGDNRFGKKVHNAGLRQMFLEKPDILHPARDFGEYLEKIRRIVKGASVINALYPSEAVRVSKTVRLIRLLLGLLPPRPWRVRGYFFSTIPLPFKKRYFFLWAIKIYRRWFDLVHHKFTPPPDWDFSGYRVQMNDWSE